MGIKCYNMAKFNGMAIAAVSSFTQGERNGLDKNNKQSVILSVLAGELPSKRVIAGTIAQSAGLHPGGVFVVCFTEGDEQEYEDAVTGKTMRGRSFNFTNGGPLKALEVIEGKKLLGEPMLRDIPAAVEVIPKANTGTTAGTGREEVAGVIGG